MISQKKLRSLDSFSHCRYMDGRHINACVTKIASMTTIAVTFLHSLSMWKWAYL
jgi:hypothetical protein